MHSTHQKFRISAYVAEFIKRSKFSPQAAKLLFAIIFLQDQTDESWPTITYKAEMRTDHFVFVAQLRELGFPAKTKSSRFLRKPASTLSAISQIFDHLEISKNGRFLTWRFSETFFAAMSNMDVYGLIDASEISLCQRKFDGALLAQITLHRKKRIPEFSLIAPNKGFERYEDRAPLPLIPSQIERQLRPSLQNWANITGVSFAVLLVQGGSRPGYTDVVVRMKHKDTQWPNGRFEKRPPASLMWTINPDTSEALLRQTLHPRL